MDEAFARVAFAANADPQRRWMPRATTVLLGADGQVAMACFNEIDPGLSSRFAANVVGRWFV
jgi:hypothetical protein